MYENDFQARMAAGRDRAKANRDGGGSTVRVFATTAALYAATKGELDSFDRWLIAVADRVAAAREEFRVSFMTADDWSVPF